MSNEKKAIPDRKVVYDEITDEAYERKSKPMNFQQLRERLKHIAGLCWGLSIDIANETERREILIAERDLLANENEALKAEIKLLRARETSRKSAKAAYRKNKADGLTSEERREKRQSKLEAKLAAMSPKQREQYMKRSNYNRNYRAKMKAKQVEILGTDGDGKTSA